MNDNIQIRDVYSAVADQTRRRILRLLADGGEMPLNKLTNSFEIGRTAVSKHLAILEEAGLVIKRRVGRETLYRTNTVPLKEIENWVSYYRKFWSEK